MRAVSMGASMLAASVPGSEAINACPATGAANLPKSCAAAAADPGDAASAGRVASSQQHHGADVDHVGVEDGVTRRRRRPRAVGDCPQRDVGIQQQSVVPVPAASKRRETAASDAGSGSGTSKRQCATPVRRERSSSGTRRATVRPARAMTISHTLPGSNFRTGPGSVVLASNMMTLAVTAERPGQRRTMCDTTPSPIQAHAARERASVGESGEDFAWRAHPHREFCAHVAGIESPATHSWG